ncbi:MAG TPA: class I SAM-dependent methyltransferase [Kineosporiaceae bacterium]
MIPPEASSGPDASAGARPPQLTGAARRWAARLSAWAIPRDILVGAPRPPWYYPPDLVQAQCASTPDTLSRGLARAALPARGSTVIDVGCGGGRAGLALAPPAELVIGVDRDAAMLEQFRAAADERRVRSVAVLGEWPAIASQVPPADVVVCHHVVYTISDLAAFGRALHERARSRVVLELRQEHPMVPLVPLWRQFWGLERPAGPTAADVVAVFREAGLPARQVTWSEPPGASRLAGVSFEREVEITRIRLCLPSERDPEVAAALRAQGPTGPRQMVTVWWDPPDAGTTFATRG